jgi:cytochrome c553
MLFTLLLTACGDNDPGIAKSMELTKKQRNMIEERIASYSVVTVSGAEEVETVVMAGELLYAACGACHGANGGGGVGPKLKGQTAEYIVGRLNQYKNGEKVGNQSNLMWGQAAGLSEKDINDLADYIVTL